ncbi:hypothetical protein GGI07_000292 [Coemansia sp. Benny D115]|nr:hypothetical protein GGI07_000292 [Coemansia sp. Benny D115]
MLAPGIAPTRRRAWLTAVSVFAKCTQPPPLRPPVHAQPVASGPCVTAVRYRCTRRILSESTAHVAGGPGVVARIGRGDLMEERSAVLQPTRECLGELRHQLGALRKSLAAKDPGSAMQLYGQIRQVLATGSSDKADPLCAPKAKRVRRWRAVLSHSQDSFKVLRALHILLWRPEYRRASDVVQVVDDIRTLGLRVGATEIAAQMAALESLGRYSEMVGLWNQAMAQVSEKGGALKHLFPQTHLHALRAAVALNDAFSASRIFQCALEMFEMRDHGSLMQKTLPGVVQSLVGALFPARTDLNAVDRPWDPSRLGSGFLRQLHNDIARWIKADHARLDQRILLYTVRALFREGNSTEAMHVYSQTASPHSANVDPRILCEVVAGLCRLNLVDEAYTQLKMVSPECRSVYVWNAYVDGVASHIRRIDEVRRAISEMQKEGVVPDTVTWTIWLRACFRSGEWHEALAWFEENCNSVHLDIICWDTAIRGLLCTSDPKAHMAGWSLVNDLVSSAESPVELRVDAYPIPDARMIDTVLLHAFPRFSGMSASPEAIPLEYSDRILGWATRNLSLKRKITHAIVIGTLLKTGNIDGALEIHRQMHKIGLAPSLAINCMIVRALASQLGDSNALGFIKDSVPLHHQAAAHFPLVKEAVQKQRYESMWSLMNGNYPAVQDSCFSGPFPDAEMYRVALRVTKEMGNFRQHRLLLDRLHQHLGLLSTGELDIRYQSFRKMSTVYSYYRSQIR